jgi:putative GTP pyrophosphokinase
MLLRTILPWPGMNIYPIFSKNQVNEAGLIIRDHTYSLDAEMNHALDVLGDWRSSHAYPLQVAYMKLRERAKAGDSKATVSQRLKRVPSILVKLRRNRNMKLSTVQDIGGCRGVVEKLADVRKLCNGYDTIVRDYIESPKSDGYRSVHLVESYKSTLSKYENLDGRKIEIQLRTRLQHAWATAVETVDSVLGQQLKVGGGEADWKRFFALASSYIALKEKSPLVPNTPTNEEELKSEIREIAEKLRVFKKLDGIAVGVDVMDHPQLPKKLNKEKICAYILILDVEKKHIEPFAYVNSTFHKISEDYLELEKKHFGDPKIQVVQIGVGQARDLKKAYPNYYLNAQDFLKTMKEVL